MAPWVNHLNCHGSNEAEGVTQLHNHSIRESNLQNANMCASDVCQELLLLELQKWISRISKHCHIEEWQKQHRLSRLSAVFCSFYLAASLYERCSSSIMHKFDFRNRTPSVTRREFTYFLLSHDYYFTAFMLHKLWARFVKMNYFCVCYLVFQLLPTDLERFPNILLVKSFYAYTRI